MSLRPPATQYTLLVSVAWLSLLATVSGSESAFTASLHSAQGRVEKRFSVSTNWNAAAVGNRFEAGDACRTDVNSRGAVLFIDGILVRLNETTQLEFKPGQTNGKKSSFRIESGSVYFFSRRPQLFPQVDTPVVSAAVRGTEFVVTVTANQTLISVLDGELECWNALNAANPLPVSAGEEAITVAGAAPVKRIMVRPWDAVQWALYYPAILDAAELIRIGFPDVASRIATEQSVAAYKRGEIAAAFAALNLVPDPKPAAVSLQQSALFLAVGQVAKAEAVLLRLDQSLANAPANTRQQLQAIAQAQRAIVALINNRRDEALSFAQQSVNTSPQSAAAALAMSYVQQGRFDLKAARRWSEKAMSLQPDSATLHARLAELELGFGELGRAVRTVEAGLASGQDDSRLLSVAGFAYLTRLQTKEALSFFNRAIALDDAAGLPHLGRGLALIRQNKLEEGRREIEIAVHLEPSDSLSRSYLGKAYFEEKRDSLASHEFGLARHFDPLDPTPWLYDAFYKAGNGRPVEALWDVEESIRLNDNRAVYRSRFLLDQDHAVRSVGLSQIFNQVGFTEAGRLEAIKSINKDYGNFSAHLLLAGSYFDRPQLNQTVISEQLLARLLAPVNINSVRGEASFNEYTSLFDRQRAQFFLLSEGRTTDDFIQGAPRVAFATERFAASVVYGARYQGGFRGNDSATLLAPATLMQYQLTPSDTLSLETIQFESQEGDTALRFNPNVADPDAKRDLDSFTQRIGWHHHFGPGSDLIAQGLYLHRDFRFVDLNEASPVPFVSRQNRTTEIHTEALRGDAQHIWDTPWLSLVVGGSVVDGEDTKQESTRFFPSFGGQFRIPSRGTTPANSQRGYLYSTWHLGPNVDLTAGASYARVEFSELSIAPSDNETSAREELDPKLGLVLRLTPSTTLRSAYYETLGAAGSADLETIEPTQVAGFNQLFDEQPGARTRGAGLGLDQKIAKWTYAGVEALWRESGWSYGADSQPALRGGADNFIFPLEAREQLLRAHLYQVLHRTTTFTVEYTLVDHQDDSSALGDRTDDSSLTHRVRLGLNYFHPRGWFAGAGGTWRHQTLDDFEPADGVLNGQRDFWIVDATIGYQFPKRTGYVALAFNNLFDQDFRYQPVGIDQRFFPDFSVNMRLFLNF
jgi:tetratricopeptide (TPR) repeat protein